MAHHQTEVKMSPTSFHDLLMHDTLIWFIIFLIQFFLNPALRGFGSALTPARFTLLAAGFLSFIDYYDKVGTFPTLLQARVLTHFILFAFSLFLLTGPTQGDYGNFASDILSASTVSIGLRLIALGAIWFWTSPFPFTFIPNFNFIYDPRVGHKN